jgi:uncharacterized membrane protein YheB (UPF0754 family)
MDVFAVVAILAAVGAVIGYTTKWVSAQLMFWPARFVGVGPFGWQGVVQRRSPKFATGIADMLETVAPVQKIAARLEPAGLAEVMTESLRPMITELAPAVLVRCRGRP